MASFNRVVLMGNLTRDPEVRMAGSGGNSVAVFGIAVNETWRSKDGNKHESVSFFDCEAWNTLGQVCGKYLKKGRRVLLEGKLKSDQWEKDGVKRSHVKVVVENFIFCDSTPKDAAASAQPTAQPTAPAQTEDSEDLPF